MKSRRRTGARIELLSPARNAEIGREAILAGADAVYIGAHSFGARSAAANSVSDIAGLCAFAHVYGAKVYAAVNTILSDAEIPRAAELTWHLADAGVDALIVQDLGLLEADIAPLELHASTQCHIDTPQKAKMLEACGFKTLVLARELNLREIAEIAAEVDAGIECFVHGALCVSYSGQCWLSHAIGGRSANRGECAQPCRMKYSMRDSRGAPVGPDAHYLCLRDLDRSRLVGAMIDAGVSSFKIEGRLKDASYVKNATAFYRGILDAEISARNLQRASFGDSRAPFEPNPLKTFNRGFTDYCTRPAAPGLASFASPKSRGEPLGTIRRGFPGGFFFDGADKTFSNSDGLYFEPKDGSAPFGAQVCAVSKDRVFVGGPEKRVKVPDNCALFRNRDAAFEKKLALPCERKIRISLALSEESGAIRLSAKTLDSRAATAFAEISAEACEPAADRAAAESKLRENLSKFGGTPFEAASLEIRCAPHLPLSKINGLRRELAENLKGELAKLHAPARVPRAPNLKMPDFPAPPFDADWRANCMNKKALAFYEKIGFPVSEPAPELSGDDMAGKAVMRTRHCVLREMGLCLKKTPEMRGRLPIFLESDQAELELRFDCRRCEMEVVFIGKKSGAAQSPSGGGNAQTPSAGGAAKVSRAGGATFKTRGKKRS